MGYDMKKKIFSYLVVFIVLIVSAYYALAWYSLTQSDIQRLIVYSLEPETSRYPPKLAEYYLYNFRGTEEDIAFLEERNGIGFVLNGADIPKESVFDHIDFLLKKGCDINSVGFDGFTALHGAILDNMPEYVAFLLKRGADINVKVGYSRIYGKEEKTQYSGMNAIELANYLSKKDKKDRSTVIEILTRHGNQKNHL